MVPVGDGLRPPTGHPPEKVNTMRHTPKTDYHNDTSGDEYNPDIHDLWNSSGTEIIRHKGPEEPKYIPTHHEPFPFA